MKLSALTTICLLAFITGAFAGNLEPTAAPGATMKTLDEVEPCAPISQADIPLNISTPGSYYLTENIVTTGTYVYGIYTGTGCTLNNNTSYANGYSATGTVYGIYIGSYSIADHNTAYNNYGVNMNSGKTGCVYDNNVSP